MILLGDVSGKGLKAAMTVSLIVGAARTLARFAPNPGRDARRVEPAALRTPARRLDSPVWHCAWTPQATACWPLRVTPHLSEQAGSRSPGHVATGYSSRGELRRGGNRASRRWPACALRQRPARTTQLTGEIFSFERLDALFATRPDAAKATQAAVNFGQDDDITVLTLTRLGKGQQSSSHLSAPHFVQVYRSTKNRTRRSSLISC